MEQAMSIQVVAVAKIFGPWIYTFSAWAVNHNVRGVKHHMHGQAFLGGTHANLVFYQYKLTRIRDQPVSITMEDIDLQQIHDDFISIALRAGDMMKAARPKATGQGTKKNSENNLFSCLLIS